LGLTMRNVGIGVPRSAADREERGLWERAPRASWRAWNGRCDGRVRHCVGLLRTTEIMIFLASPPSWAGACRTW